MSSKNVKMQLSVNHALVGKPSQRDIQVHSARGWEAVELTASQLEAQVTAGIAFAPQYKEGHRKIAKFESAGFLAADFDGTCTLNEARDDAFVNSYASLIYTTPSYTEGEHHFRIVFALVEPITDAQVWADAQLGLAHRLQSDPAVSDAARCFFGSAGASTWVMDNLLPPEVVEELADYGRDLRAARRGGFSVFSTLKLDTHLPVQLANGEWQPFENIKAGTSIHCPYHDDRRPSAFVVPSWTLGGTGLHCRACGLTYWPAAHDEYDFHAFEKMFERKSRPHEPDLEEAVGLSAFFPPDPKCYDIQRRYLPYHRYEPGITLIKSPKGTGKTELIRQLIADIRHDSNMGHLKRSEKPKSVLLIGHRRALLREAAWKLGLYYYQDDWQQGFDRYMAVCLDSLPSWNESYVVRRDGPRLIYDRDKPHDLVIIDESEQVLRHLLGGTINKKPGNLDRCYDALCYEVANAKGVIAADADMSLLTAHALHYLRPQDWRSRTRIIWNRPETPTQRQTLLLFEQELALREELLKALGEGKRCFVATNSKRHAQVLRKIIEKKFAESVPMRVITSENSRELRELEFVKNIREEFLKIQVLICSPSLGTGIDITFPDSEANTPGGLCRVDEVFGFFYPKVNTHTDMDQQLSRVRKPGAVKVWISPGRSRYSSNFDVVRDDLARSYAVPRAVKGRSTADGLVKWDNEEPLLMITAHVTASQRASKNNLIQLFIELREANGWTVEVVKTRLPSNKDRSEAERAIWNSHVSDLLKAPILTDAEFLDLIMRDKDSYSREERITYEKNNLEKALDVVLTYDIIKMNHDGGLLGRVETLSRILRNWTTLKSFTEAAKAAQELPLARLPMLKESDALLVYALGAAGLVDDKGIRADIRVALETLKDFAPLCRRNATVLETLLGSPLRRDIETNPVRQLNAFLKLAGLKLHALRREKSAGKTTRYYGFDPEEFGTMRSLAASFKSADDHKQELQQKLAA